jgi:hypothetical protein
MGEMVGGGLHSSLDVAPATPMFVGAGGVHQLGVSQDRM